MDPNRAKSYNLEKVVNKYIENIPTKRNKVDINTKEVKSLNKFRRLKTSYVRKIKNFLA